MTQLEEFDHRIAHLKAEIAHAEDLLDMLEGEMSEIKEALGLPQLKRLLASARPPSE